MISVRYKSDAVVDAELTARILAQSVEHPSGCLLWQGYVNKDGYGSIKYRRRSVRVHRAVLVHTTGTSSDVARHKCDTPACVRAAHLEWGSQRDNVQDMVERGRVPRGEARPTAVLTAAQVKEIRRRLECPYFGINRDLAKEFNVKQNTISQIRHGKKWTHLGHI